MVPMIDWSGYFVGSDGGIYSEKPWHGTSFRRMSERVSRDGYSFVQLTGQCSGGRTKPKLVHRAVAEAFLGPCPPEADQLRHLNGNKRDNRPSNLQWGTAAENAADRDRHGRTARGERNGGGRRLRAIDVLAIKGRLRAGEAQASIAATFGVSQALVGFIAIGRLWRGVG